MPKQTSKVRCDHWATCRRKGKCPHWGEHESALMPGPDELCTVEPILCHDHGESVGVLCRRVSALRGICVAAK